MSARNLMSGLSVVIIVPSLEYESHAGTLLVLRVFRVAPVIVSLIRTVLFKEPDASCIPSGENARATTNFDGPRESALQLP